MATTRAEWGKVDWKPTNQRGGAEGKAAHSIGTVGRKKHPMRRALKRSGCKRCSRCRHSIGWSQKEGAARAGRYLKVYIR